MVVNVSKTYDFNPTLGGLLINAFGRCGVRPSEITQTHLLQGQLSANFLLAELSNLQPNLWEVNLNSIPLTEGRAKYSLPAETVMVLDLYISTGSGQQTNDRYLYPISRTEYASYPNKNMQGFPTVYWFDRLISPTVTFWAVPDGNGPYVAKYYSVRQTMDAVAANGLTVEVPYRFLDTYAAGLAWKLSELYAPQLEDKLFSRYQRSLQIATTQDIENVQLSIMPGIGNYYRT